MKHYSEQLRDVLKSDISIWEGVGSPSHPYVMYELIVKNTWYVYVGQSSNLGRRIEGHKRQYKWCDELKKYINIWYMNGFNSIQVKVYEIPKIFKNAYLFDYRYDRGWNKPSAEKRGINLFERYMIRKRGNLNYNRPKVCQTALDYETIKLYEESLA